MSKYSAYLDLARQHEITSFTALQEEAFRSENIGDSEKNLFVIGETSAGKTLVPLLLYEQAVIEALRTDAPYPKMLFVVPYRALAAQKKRELEDFFRKYDLRIAQSTGEFRESDLDIQSGCVDIAVIITEKAFKFQARDEDFLSRYNLLVLDEVGLIDNEDRGIYFDFLFAWGSYAHQKTKSLRIIALGTPFYNWDTYITHFGFSPIATNAEREVRLEKHSIVYNRKKSEITKVQGGCEFLFPSTLWTAVRYKRLESTFEQVIRPCSIDAFCPVKQPCRSDLSLICGKTGRPCSDPVIVMPKGITISRYILLQICRHHLLQDQQILIFLNNREEVLQLSIFLYQELKKMPELAGIFPPPPPADECCREVLKDCGLDSDDVYGILEFEDGTILKKECYQALVSGIAFHSAALPNELRTYIEMRLLDSPDTKTVTGDRTTATQKMKIVCSTETLAFGVNSTVDVVIIADLLKQQRGSARALTINEYGNYIGRAGRLCVGMDATQRKGTVYTLIRDNWESVWEKQQAEPLPCMSSKFYDESSEKMPFFLLNLIPENTLEGVTFGQLLEIARMMPGSSDYSDESLEVLVRDAEEFLIKHRLLEKKAKSASGGRGSASRWPVYYLTELGSRMRGYILEKDDYEQLKSAVREYVDSVYWEPDKTTFLYRLLSTKHASSALNGTFENAKSKVSFEELCKFIQSERTDSSQAETPTWMTRSNEKFLFVLAAVLSWCDGESARSIYNSYGVQFALISRFSQQVGYLVEVAKELIPESVEQRYRIFKFEFPYFSSFVKKPMLSTTRSFK